MGYIAPIRVELVIIGLDSACKFIEWIYYKGMKGIIAIILLGACVIAGAFEGSRCDTDCCRTLSDRMPMSYTYYQKTGRFVGGSGEYKIDTKAYSGKGKGYLNPDEQCTPFIGPIPASTYKLAFCKNKMH